MNHRLLFITTIVLLVLLLSLSGTTAQGPELAGQVGVQAAVGTTFTYQGQLTDGSSPANGTYDLQFSLYDVATKGTPIGTVTIGDKNVARGLFTVELDFGLAAKGGEARYLEVGVRPGDSIGAFTALSPRQALTPVPYAMYSANAPWDGLTGVPADFGDNTDDDSLAGLSCGSGQVAKWNGSAWACADDDTDPGGAAWSLAGNAGTTPVTHFLGTTDGVSLTLAVSGTAALRLEPSAESPNLIGGYSGNSVISGVVGATISGGGAPDDPWGPLSNRVTDHYGTVGGGQENQAGDGAGTISDAPFATVGGGEENSASSYWATVGGGMENKANGSNATVSGGGLNTAGSTHATVSGGYDNVASGWAATIGGGVGNTASGWAATIGGGDDNTANGSYPTLGGGSYNVVSGTCATISGGGDNTASGDHATVGGGYQNTASGNIATIGGGSYNTVTSTLGTVGGGTHNFVYGENATVPGGWANTAVGDNSFAAGTAARADHAGAFIWADYSSVGDFTSQRDNQFRVRAFGGAQFTNYSAGGHFVELMWSHPISTSLGAYLSWGGTWTNGSDVALKENLAPVDSRDVLLELVDVPISTWNYKTEDASIHHMGPTAQDFYAAFGLGDSDRAISTVDADGVALAAIQGLYQVLQEKDDQIAAQQQQIAALETRLGTLERAVEASSVPATSFSHSLSQLWLPFSGLLLVGLVLGQRWRTGGGQ